MDESPGEAQALLFHEDVGELLEAHEGKEFPSPPACLFAGQVVKSPKEEEVLQARELSVEGALASEDHADSFAHLLGSAHRVVSLHPDLARAG